MKNLLHFNIIFLFQFLNAQYEGYSEESWNGQLKIEESLRYRQLHLKNI